MDTSSVSAIARDLLLTALLLSVPAVGVSLIVGLVISVLQTLTSIQEQTLSFAPRILAVGVTLTVCLPWIIRVTTSFTYRMMLHFVEAGR